MQLYHFTTQAPSFYKSDSSVEPSRAQMTPDGTSPTKSQSCPFDQVEMLSMIHERHMYLSSNILNISSLCTHHPTLPVISTPSQSHRLSLNVLLPRLKQANLELLKSKSAVDAELFRSTSVYCINIRMSSWNICGIMVALLISHFCRLRH